MSRLTATPVLAAIMFTLFPAMAFGATADDIFAKAFGGKAAPQEQVFDAPILFLIYELDPVPVRIDPDGTVFVERSPLLDGLNEVLTASALKTLDAQLPGGEDVSLDAIRTAGLALTYDSTALALRLDLKPDQQKAATLSLSSRRAIPKTLAPSSPFSARLNLRAATGLASGDGVEEDGRESVTAFAEAAIHLRGLVLEVDGEFIEGATDAFGVAEARLLYDDRAARRRTILGDHILPVSGFQSPEAITGLTVTRSFAAQPDRTPRPTGQRILTLDRQANVDVLSAGRIVDTFRLPPGRFNVTDFPVAIGPNDFILRITDDTGQTQIEAFSVFFASTLLAAQESDYGVSLGFPSLRGGSWREVDTDHPLLSAFHRQGLSDTVTAGTNIQLARGQINTGMELAWANAAGTFDLISDISVNGTQTGVRLAAQYDLPPLWDQSADIPPPVFNLLTDYRSIAYTGFGEEPDRQNTAVDVTARLGQSFPYGLSANLTGQYTFPRDGIDAASSVSTQINWRLNRAASIDFTGTQRQTETGVEAEWLLGLSIIWGQGRRSSRLSHDSAADAFRVDWAHRPAQRIGGTSFAVSAVQDQTGGRADVNVRHTGQRAEAILDHRTIRRSVDIADTRENRTTLSIGTGLVYADGSAALTRPVSDAFAMIRRHPQLRDVPIQVNPGAAGPAAKTDGLGPLVLPDLASHVARPIRLDAPALAAGQSLGEERPWLRPGLRGGVVLMAGTAGAVVLQGRLIDQAGEPVGLISGTLAPEAGDSKDTTVFFSNRNGQIVIDGLPAGFYTLQLSDGSGRQARLEIPEDASGFYDYGDIRL